MKHVIRINQPEFVGSTVISFEDEGKARLAVDTLNASGDGRTTAEYLGKASPLHVTFAPKTGSDAPSLRRQAMECYERALPHRQAFDVLDLKPGEDQREFTCYVLGGFRK